MRKIEKELQNAIAGSLLRREKETWHKGNTRVTYDCVWLSVYLYETKIAQYNTGTGVLTIANGGYHTNTTRGRLNVVLDTFGMGEYRIAMRKGKHALTMPPDRIVIGEFSRMTFKTPLQYGYHRF